MIRAAVIGAGQIAKQHLAALASLRRVEVVGVCDLSPIMAEATADRFGVRNWYTDYRELLDVAKPAVVHIVTPASTHFPLARDALDSGCHVLVEKPITQELAELDELLDAATAARRWLVEDHNYLYNDALRQMLARRDAGEFGVIRRVDVQLNLAIFGPGSRFSDGDLPHPALCEPIGPVSDFLTHLCYLAHAFVGPHHRVETVRLTANDHEPPRENFRALIAGRDAVATIGFCSDSQPDAFTVRVEGTRMQMETNLFEVGSLESRLLSGPNPLQPIRNALSHARAECRNAFGSLKRKLSGGPGAYEGLWELVRQLYIQLETGSEPPIAPEQIREVSQLVHDVVQGASSPCAC
jgi:predicted dehydrogenase